MTEKEFLETKIKHLQERKRLMNAEINFKIKILDESLAMQKGFTEAGRHGEIEMGKYGYRYKLYGD